MHASSPAPIPLVVQQHVEDAAILRTTRTVLVRAPHVKLHHLRRLDDRLSAHLDGVAVAGEFGRRLAESALENAGVGEVFTAAVGAIDDKNLQALGKTRAIGRGCAGVLEGAGHPHSGGYLRRDCRAW